MIELHIDNSISQLKGLSTEVYRQLKSCLSYHANPQSAFFAGGFNPKRYLIDKHGSFPTGLLYIVVRHLNLTNERYAVIDHRKRPQQAHGLFKLKLPYPPYAEQLEAAQRAIVHERGIIAAPTGLGKSVICALIINAVQVPTLIVVPSLELKRQLTDALKGTFGDTRDDLKVINIDALDPSKVETKYKCVIIDEFHHSGAKSYRKLNQKAWNNIYYRFGLTATPFRSQDNEKLLLESVLSNIIYAVDHKTAVKKGYIVPLEAYYIDLPKKPVKGTTWAQVYNELVVNNIARNEVIGNLISHLHANKKSTLCLVKEIAHGNALSTITGAGFANGQSDDCQDLISWFSSGRLTTLIGTTGVVGEGVDTKAAEYVIIAGLGKSKNAFMQQCGRSFRKFTGKESAKVIIFRDSSNKWTLAHYRAQCKILLDEYGIKPIKLDL